jgi:hypothetical protein
MANKQAVYTFGGINQDMSKAKHVPQYYFEAEHIRLLSTDTQSTGGVANEKGNSVVISIPDIKIITASGNIEYGVYDSQSGNIINPTILSYTSGGEIDQQISNGLLNVLSTSQKIIGHTTTRNSIILFSTDETVDCVWELNGVLTGNYSLSLLYLRNLDFSINRPIQAIFNYENQNIQKVYWVDGYNQIRLLNIKNNQLENSGLLIDIIASALDFVGQVNFSQPVINDIVSGGSHTAGMIQYAYNLYRLNSSQTKISPLSEIVPLDKGTGQGGGDVNEEVGAVPIVEINNIDQAYSHIKVYAIKYTSLSELPSIDLIEERELNGDTSITIYDDGRTISSLSISEFLFLGSTPVVPKHIEAKDNRMFLSNIKDKAFDLPASLDMRAYSFAQFATTTRVYENPQFNSDGSPQLNVNYTNVTSPNFAIPLEHDAINLDYNLQRWNLNNEEGGTGKYIEYTLQNTFANQLDNNVEDYRFFKAREIYRIGIQFYNRLGQISPPKWIADFKAPSNNLNGQYNTLDVKLTAEFFVWLNTYNFESEDDKPVGFKILRADRTLADKTIICQGPLGSMMVNSPRDSEGASLYNTAQKRTDSDEKAKLPNILLRTFQDLKPLRKYEHLRSMQERFDSNSALREVRYDSSERKADSYQYNVMYQMYSPEIMFESVPLNSSLLFNVVGGLENTFNAYWGKELNVNSQLPSQEGQTTGKITPHVSGGTESNLVGDADNLMDRGLISDTNGSNPNVSVEFNQWYREFGNFEPATNILTYEIFGTPEYTGQGQGLSTYNNDTKYKYSNSLEGFLSDGDDGWDDDGPTDRAIISLNSWGAPCVTFVSDDGTQTNVESYTRPTMSDIYYNASINNTNTIILSELVKPLQDTYRGNIYGGNSYEDKSRSSYIEIGEYQDIGTSPVTLSIFSPGDTYVQNYNFLRISPTNTSIFQIGINQITESVSVLLETTVDLKNRNDESLSTWSTNFQPLYDTFHKYNRVYSQQPNLVESQSISFNFQRIKEFDARIQATKLKIPNETVDSWTDVLTAEVLDLNGKYGPINNIVLFKDNLFAFQDEAIARILINPKVQVQSTDGLGLELGTGGILYDFDYLTTKSGSINKWGIIPTKTGIYYYDALNKGVGVVPSESASLLSDEKGLHTYFNNNFNYDLISIDNPYLNSGVVFGYDNFNSDIYMTLLQGDQSFTRCYNEAVGEFIDLKTYLPPMYIYKGEKLFALNTSGTTIYEQGAGEYNNFFGSYSPSTITLMVNPHSNYATVFDNIHYASELYLNDIDQPDKTLTHIRAYNEYQDSGRIELVNGRGTNLRRKFREWKANIPREDRNRMRNTWIYLTLELDNESNYKFILHDVTVNYTV